MTPFEYSKIMPIVLPVESFCIRCLANKKMANIS